jgi:hypothetical protein
MRLVDFEYAGWNDPMVDLADLVEGIWARPISDGRWTMFLDEFDLTIADRLRLDAARRLCAFHWVYLLSKKLTHDPAARSELHQQIERALLLLS